MPRCATRWRIEDSPSNGSFRFPATAAFRATILLLSSAWGVLLCGPSRRTGVANMDNITFGVTLTVLGMAGTLASLWVLSLLIQAVKKLYPLETSKPADSSGKGSKE
jgi:hypothetical protein